MLKGTRLGEDSERQSGRIVTVYGWQKDWLFWTSVSDSLVHGRSLVPRLTIPSLLLRRPRSKSDVEPRNPDSGRVVKLRVMSVRMGTIRRYLRR